MEKNYIINNRVCPVLNAGFFYEFSNYSELYSNMIRLVCKDK